MRVTVLLPLLLFLSGCSVAMAASGEKDPDLGAIHVGSHRSDVELHLGDSVESEIGRGGRIDTYLIEMGDEPSTGRAVAHGVMDILTLGIWEIFFTPVEGFKGDDYKIVVRYDNQDRAVHIKKEED